MVTLTVLQSVQSNKKIYMNPKEKRISITALYIKIVTLTKFELIYQIFYTFTRATFIMIQDLLTTKI